MEPLKRTLLNHRILTRYPSESTERLPELCHALLHQQQSSWPELTAGYAALRDVRVREIQSDGYSVYIQFNPKRIVSSGARVDPKSISERKCFLCLQNLPVEQKAILYRDAFLVLCNPVPIFDKHLTIAHIEHIPQSIEQFIPVFLELASAMSPSFTIFYNGPKCGASAPDHMHFQACPTGTIPVEREVPVRRVWRKTLDAVSICTLKWFGREVIVLEGDDTAAVELAFVRLIDAMKHLVDTTEEPMLNVLCSYADGGWRLIVFPRRKHRPDVYSKEGDERVMISPASVDIGGLLVAPIEEDFNRVDAKMIQSIYDEVLVDRDMVDRILVLM